MTREDETCRRTRPLLDDLVDGRLSAADRERVRRHLAACAACAARLASLEELLARTAELPRAVAPARDLWPEVSPRLAPRPAGRPARRPAWRLQAAAAVVFMALGGLLSQALWPGFERPRHQRSGGEAAALREGPAPTSFDRRVDFALAEADYLRAKEALWAAVYHGRAPESAETREVVERNLRVIDAAIEELRHALAADPGNQRLESLLLAQHRTEIGLLQRLRKATETS